MELLEDGIADMRRRLNERSVGAEVRVDTTFEKGNEKFHLILSVCIYVN